MDVVKVTNLVKKYSNLVAVDNLSFRVKKGEILGLLGPNGSGKSTTINCILSLLEYDSGSICLFEEEMKPSSYHLKQKIGVIMQNVAVFNELTVYENIDYFCGLYIKDKTLRKKYVQEAIDLVDLNEYKKFLPKKLSGGLLRRLNIACGISHKPELIILDEPTVAVDPQSRNSILEGIQKLNNDGATIIYTTHYMEEVEQICDYIIILDHGNVIKEGSKEDIKDSMDLGEKIVLTLDSYDDKIINKIKDMGNVLDVSLNKNHIVIRYKKGKNNLIKLIDYLNKEDIKILSVNSTLPSLNDVFLELTGKELRD